MPRHAAPTWLPVRASPWPRRFRRGRIAQGWLSFAKVSSAGVLRNHTPPCRPPVQPACRACHPRVRDLCLSSPQRLEEDGEPGALGARAVLARCVRGACAAVAGQSALFGFPSAFVTAAVDPVTPPLGLPAPPRPSQPLPALLPSRGSAYSGLGAALRCGFCGLVPPWGSRSFSSL